MTFAILDIALLASEPQTLERSTMAINFDQIAGNEETSLSHLRHITLTKAWPKAKLQPSTSVGDWSVTLIMNGERGSHRQPKR